MADLPAAVIYNPAAGRGRAARHIERIRQVLGEDRFRLVPTARPGQAEELARQAAEAGAACVVAAGGDGTVHEVANGLLTANRVAVFAVWPIGSANDYAESLGLTDWRRLITLPAPVPHVAPVDVGLVREPSGRQRYFVNGLGLGFNGAVTHESRQIDWLRGMPLYSLAVVRAMIWHFVHPRMRIRLDDHTRDEPTLALSVNLARREGNFPLTPRADLQDGLFDILHATSISRWELLRYFPAMATGTLPLDHPRLWQGRAAAVDVESEKPLRVHLDGEFFCQPEDGVRQIEIRLLPGRLRVQLYPGAASGDAALRD